MCQYKRVEKADAKNVSAFNLHLGSAGRMHSIEQKTTFSKAEKYSRKTIMQGGTVMAYKTIRNKSGRIVLAGTVSASMALTALGTAGLWLAIPCAELLTTLCIIVYSIISYSKNKSKKNSRKK